MPTPIAAYDPTRRIFIGGLSPQTTTKDIIAAIKTKTKALPTHVEIALSKKLNTAQQKEKDPLAPAAPITRRRKPKIKIPGCSSSDDDDEILHMNYKKKPDQQQQQQQQQQQSVGQDAAVAKNGDKNNNNNSDDSDNDDTKQQNNNKKGKNNKDAAAAGGEKKPLRDCRGFAHVTVEGLKQVTEQLHGVMVNDKPIRVQQAKPHYLWKLENVKRQQEKEDEKKQSEVESIRSKEGYGELDYTKPLLRSTTAAKAKFGKIASQIADKLRQKAKERKQKMKAMNARQQQYQQGGGNPKFGATRRPREDDGSSQKHPDSNKKPFNNANRNASAGGKGGGKKDSNKKEAAAAPPPPPPEPTKQDRKLSALEARLAALQAKLKKK